MKQSRIAIIAIAVSLVAFASSCTTSTPVASDSDLALRSVSTPELIARLTGHDSMNETAQYNIAGTDLGSMFEHEGSIYFVFGDTFGSRSPGQIGAGGGAWRSNALLFSTDFDASDGILFDGAIATPSGSAKQVIHSPHSRVEITKIPTHGVSVDGTIYLYFMSVAQWGEAGNWIANYAGVAKSTDDGQNFEVIEELQWPGDSNFVQVSIERVDDYLYFWSIPSGRFGPATLMRVLATEIERFEAYEYFSGTRGGSARWSPEMSDAATIVDAPVGELSVVWNEYLERWIMTYLNDEENQLEIREARDLWGPWSRPVELVDAAQRPGLYGAYMHPAYFEESGRIIYFNMSLWGPYNVFLMRTELERRD